MRVIRLFITSFDTEQFRIFVNTLLNLCSNVSINEYFDLRTRHHTSRDGTVTMLRKVVNSRREICAKVGENIILGSTFLSREMTDGVKVGKKRESETEFVNGNDKNHHAATLARHCICITTRLGFGF